MDSQFDLNTHTYSIPKLNMLSWGLVAAALGSAIASHYGSYPQSADMCFYPVAAQEKDNKIREQQTENSLTNVSTNSQKNLNKKLLFGSRFCNIRRGDIGTIPKSYLVKAEQSSVNDQASNLAVISQGLREGWLYQLQEFPAENPYKLVFGWATIGFSGLALWSLNFQRDQMSLMRPKYRATHRQASIQAGYSLAFVEADLKMSAELLLVKLRGLREADARKVFLNSLTQEQAYSLLSSMSGQDYEDFGYLIDNGASFNKFISASVAEEAQLEDNAEYEPVMQDSTEVAQDKPQQQYTRTDNIPREDKYAPFRQAGLDIIKQAGSPGKSKALIAPSRTGKTTVVYFMLEETIKLVGEENLTCYVWHGKGIEPVHPSVPRENHFKLDSNSYGLESLDQVWAEYKLRGELLEQGHRNFAPIILIITDWQSIKDELSDVDKKKFDTAKTRIRTLANNGAALGTTVWLDTQSAVVEDWGLGSSGIRDNFDIFALARIGVDNGGQPIGDTKCITKVISNNYLVPSERDRTKATEDYHFLLDGLDSGKIKSSIIMSTAGKVRLGITPMFERKALQFANAPKPEPKPTDIWDEPEDPQPVEQPKKVEFVNNEPKELSLKQKVELLVKASKNYKQICATLWGDKPLEEIAPILGSCCRLDKINILSECASYLLGVLRGLGWVDVTSDNFYHLIDDELADFQISEGLEELRLLGFIQVDDTNVRALY